MRAHFFGTVFSSFFEVFCIKVAEAQRFGFNEPFWLMATGRATVPTLYACCLTKRSCHFLFVARVGLCCWFCDFPVSFLVPPDGPKNGTVKVLFFYSFTKLCMRSQKWVRQAVPFFAVFKVHFLKFFVSRLQKRNVLVSMNLFGLWRPEGQLGRPFWAKPVLRSFSGPRIGSVGASCFVDDFVSCWGKRGAYRLLLEPSWRMLKVAFYDFVSSGGLIVCC